MKIFRWLGAAVLEVVFCAGVSLMVVVFIAALMMALGSTWEMIVAASKYAAGGM